jgi:hypothetical protein
VTLELHLGKLQQRTHRRLLRLTEVLATAPTDSHEQDRRVAFVTIEALNSWIQFCRYFYLCCALGGKEADGTRLSPAAGRLATTDDALTFAIHLMKPTLKAKSAPWSPWDEPIWRKAGDFSKIMRALDTANVPKVVGAVSLATSALNDLPAFRNFYAHRSDSTVKNAQKLATKYVISAKLHPTQILTGYAPGRPRSVLHEWLDDLFVVVDLMS